MLGTPPITCFEIEVNHCLDAEGNGERFVQVIFWRLYGRSVHVAWWCMVEKLLQLYRNGERVLPWTAMLAGDDGVLREIRARKYKETWTDYDPEEGDRKVWPIDRRGL